MHSLFKTCVHLYTLSCCYLCQAVAEEDYNEPGEDGKDTLSVFVRPCA